MSLTKPPACEFDTPAADFNLLGVDDRYWSLEECRGDKGLMVMFICNHCPYVKAIRERLVEDTRTLLTFGIASVAIMPNDATGYPEDSMVNMKRIATEFDFPFPYLMDQTQEAARAFGAVCTPDFFGYNDQLQLQFRGRLDNSGINAAPPGAPRELVEDMRLVAETGKGPEHQTPSMGCSIKWRSK